MQARTGQLYTVTRTLLTPVRRFCWQVRTEGFENLPADGPVVLTPNHVSFLDSAFLLLVLPRRITFVGKAEYMDDWKTKYFFPAVGMIPIDRSGGSASERALAAAGRVLERGELFGIFPEGTRSRDGILHRGHTGAARLALETGAPIVPVGIRGTREIQPPDAKLPRLFMPASIRLGRAIDVSQYLDRTDVHRLCRQITDEVMYEVRELSGQRYLDTYATKKAEDVPTEVARVATSPEGHGPADHNGEDAAASPSPAGVPNPTGGATGHR